MARRFTRGRFVRPPARTKMWIGHGVGSTTIAAGSQTLVSSYSAGTLLLRPFTILRTRAEVTWRSDQHAVDEAPEGDMGEIIVSSEAVGIGVTAIPDPSSSDGDPEADWYVHQALMTAMLFGSNTGFIEPAGHRFTIDSKAMRKVGPNQDSVTIVSEIASLGAVFTMRGRQLIQLH